ncbi:MAG: hypothetical protein QOE58_2631 [Actinomycetota bacterium]|nr:hypothetical protein [Actinomycetota bacterium]
MISIRDVTRELGYGSPLRLRVVCDTQHESLKALALKARARRFNVLPFPIGLPIDPGFEAVEEPIITRNSSGRLQCEFRGGVLTEPDE